MLKVKIHQAYRYVVAICDASLIGKKFENENMKLEIGTFFDGEDKSKEEVLEIIQHYALEDATFNIVGKQACEVALKAGIINEEGIKYVANVPVALVLL